jgi:hypothetical protein
LGKDDLEAQGQPPRHGKGDRTQRETTVHTVMPSIKALKDSVKKVSERKKSSKPRRRS